MIDMYWFDDRKLMGPKEDKTKAQPQCLHYKKRKVTMDVKRSIEGRTQLVPKVVVRVYCGDDEHKRSCGALRKEGLCWRMNKW